MFPSARTIYIVFTFEFLGALKLDIVYGLRRLQSGLIALRFIK
jgi:hypothetical protein